MLSDDLTNAVFELANVAMLLNVSALYIASREIQANGAALLRTIATVGTVDAAHQRRLVPRRNDRLDTPGLSVPVSHLDDERPTSPAAGRGGPELHHTCASTRRPRDWVEHVREVHLPAHDRRERGAGANRQHLPGNDVQRAGLHGAKRHRQGRRPAVRHELLHKDG